MDPVQQQHLAKAGWTVGNKHGCLLEVGALRNVFFFNCDVWGRCKLPRPQTSQLKKTGNHLY